MGRWTVDDEVFEVVSTTNGALQIRNSADNEETSVLAEDARGACELTIQVLLNEVPAGSGDWVRRVYELIEHDGKVDGLLSICSFGDNYDGVDMATAACPKEDSSVRQVSGTRSPL